MVGGEGERDDAAVRPPGGGLRGVSQSPLLYHMIVHAKGEERPPHLTQHTDTIGNYNYRIRATSPRRGVNATTASSGRSVAVCGYSLTHNNNIPYGSTYVRGADSSRYLMETRTGAARSTIPTSRRKPHDGGAVESGRKKHILCTVLYLLRGENQHTAAGFGIIHSFIHYVQYCT